MLNLWNLDEDILLNVLSEWTYICDLTCLDTATGMNARQYLLSLVKEINFVHIGLVTPCSDEYYQWLILKNVRVRNMNLLSYNDKPLGIHLTTVLKNQNVLKQLLMRHCYNLHKVLDCCHNISAMKFHNNPDLSDLQLSETLAKFDPILSNIGLRGCKDVTDKSAEWIATKYPQLQRFENYGCAKMTAKSLITIAKGCHELWELIPSSVVNDEAIHAIADNCPSLKILRMKHTSSSSDRNKVTDDSIIHLARGCTRLETLQISPNSHVTNKSIAALTGHCLNLRQLQLSQSDLRDEGVEQISRLTHLQVLSLSGCVRLTDLSMCKVVKGCFNLRELVLNHCALLTDNTVVAIADNCPLLNGLSLNRCHLISDSSLLHLVNTSRAIERINAHDTQMTGVVFVSLAERVRGVEQLELVALDEGASLNHSNISVTNCRSVSLGGDERNHHAVLLRYCSSDALSIGAVTTLLTSCGKSLLVMTIENYEALENDQLLDMVAQCPRLHTLTIEKCPKVTAAAVLETCRSSQSLHSLIIPLCTSLTNDLLTSILQAVGLRLRALHISDCSAVSDSSLAHLATLCTDITSLDVSGCDNVSDDSMQLVACHCSRLKHLDVSRTGISEDTLHDLCQACPPLVSLAVSDCIEISARCEEVSLMKIVSAMPSIRVVRFSQPLEYRKW